MENSEDDNGGNGSSDESFPCLHIKSTGKHLTKEIRFDNGVQVCFIVDTGSPVSLMDRDFFNTNFPTTTVKQYNGQVSGVTGHNMSVDGYAEVQTENGPRLKFLLIFSKTSSSRS